MASHTNRMTTECGCSFEIIFDDEVFPTVNQLYYTHNVCPTHEPLVKDKPKLSMSKWKKQRDDILKDFEKMLDNNKTKNLKDYDEHPEIIKKRNAIVDMKKELALEKHALRLEAELDTERGKINNQLDTFKDEKMAQCLLGIYSPYAFISQEVYDKVLEESAIKNPIIDNE